MPAVWLKVRFKGRKGEAEAEGLLNSGSDIVVLPKNMAEKIKPRPVGKIEIELANGKIIKRDAYEVEMEVENPETGDKKEIRAISTVEKRDYPLIGITALEKLKINPDVIRGRVIFEE